MAIGRAYIYLTLSQLVLQSASLGALITGIKTNDGQITKKNTRIRKEGASSL